MSRKDNKPEPEPVGPDDPLSSTEMFLGAIRRQADSAPTRVSPPRMPVDGASPDAPGEFTQIFGSLKTSSPVVSPSPKVANPSADVTRVFPTSAPPSVAPPEGPMKKKGYSSSGVSDSASDEGTFTQIFGSISPAPKAGPPYMASEEARLPDNRPRQNTKPSDVNKEAFGITEPPVRESEESYTNIFDRLTAHKPAKQIPDAQRPISEVESVSDPGGDTRRFDQKNLQNAAPRAESATRSEISAGVQVNTAPKVAALLPAVPAQSKLQEMIPILLLVNAFLLVAVIVLIIFVLLRR